MTMPWTVHPSASSRHLLLRAGAGEIVPDSLAAKLREEGVSCGWLRASGVLQDVELRAFDGTLATLGSARRIDRLEIWWPSGRRQIESNLDVDRVITIREQP